jgi:hypothetical protein
MWESKPVAKIVKRLLVDLKANGLAMHKTIAFYGKRSSLL